MFVALLCALKCADEAESERPCISPARGKVERAAGEIAAEYVNMCTRIVSPYLGECHRERDKREEGY